MNKELGTDMAFGEVDHGSRLWLDIGKKSTEQVKVPILDASERMVHCGCLTGQEPHVCEKAFLQKPPPCEGRSKDTLGNRFEVR